MKDDNGGNERGGGLDPDLLQQADIISYLVVGFLILLSLFCGRLDKFRAMSALAKSSVNGGQSKAEEVDLVAKLQLGDTVAINYKRDMQFATPSVEKLLPEDELLARGKEGDEKRE